VERETKLGLGALDELDDERLQFAKQLGVDSMILNTPDLPGHGYWEFAALLRMRTRVEAEGRTLYAIENMPRGVCGKIRHGLPGRDEQIENVQKTIRNVCRA